ncbi:MAG: hypothetical protein M3Q70_03405, partial [bacterium]|nr:hypothetical protein [bacterium]
MRFGYAGLAGLFLFVTTYQAIQSKTQLDKYDISKSEGTLLKEPLPQYANLLRQEQGKITYNQGYVPGQDTAGESSSPKLTAEFEGGSHGKVTVTDPVNQVSVAFRPLFNVSEPLKNENRVIYPIIGKNAAAVFTAQGTNLKEDIIVNSYSGNTLSFDYDLELPDSLEARMENDGSIGIYGVDSSLLGNVSTGSGSDEELLNNARKNAEKTQLIFSIPAPFINEVGKTTSAAKTWFTLSEKVLKVHATNLKEANYPLSIDPSVYVETARKLMRGNNDTNLDFDVDNELIQKGKLTGARFNNWTNTMALPAARWNHATAVAGGFVYVLGGNDGTNNRGNLYWAKFNTSSFAIEATNPGAGACSDWCTSSNYDLPSSQTRVGHSLVTYNGFLYAIGGTDNSGTRTNTVYISKLGANGEPQLWHPTDTNKANWVYWYSSSKTLATATSYGAAAIYNNRIYYVGGQTAATSGVTTVSFSSLLPTGDLVNWTTTGMTQLSSGAAGRYHHAVQIYNDRIYVIGGASGTTTQTTVYYIKLNTDGTMTGNWLTTNAFSTGRASMGGNMSTIWGGYIYVSSGCSVLNASGYCTTIRSDIQIASINADGSVTDWGTVTGVTSSRIGFGFIGWRNTLYAIGGCTAQNTTTGACTTTSTNTQYGVINQDGDASTVSTSVASGVAPCSASTWYDCDLPPEGDGNGQSGRMSGASIINNGFIYYLGGCTAVNSSSVCYTGNAGKSTDNVSYASIAADGSITRIAACTGGSFVGSWCVINPGLGASLSAFGYTVFNNVMYVIGGTTGTLWEDEVWRATFNTDGSWGAWTSQTFANLDLGNAKGYQYVFTRGNPSLASTFPGNLYILGGCSGVIAADDGLDCSGSMYSDVYKCNITPTGALEEADANDCTTTGQLQIDSEPGTGGNQGLGVMAGTVYANYIYLIGGQSPNEQERGQVIYAKIDNSNNIVATTGSTWTTSANTISPVRRRGAAFGYNGYLYALAGYNVSGGGSLNDLLLAKISVSDGSIGAFSTSQVTVSARWDLRLAANNGYVYAIGGCSAGAPPASCTVMTGTVQTFQLYNNYSGSPASYSSGTQFGTDRYGASAAVLNGYIYMAGGCMTAATDCTTASSDVQYALLNNDGTIGTWASTTATLPVARAWGQLEAAGGSLYFIGGQASGSNNGNTNVYYATPISGGNIT